MAMCRNSILIFFVVFPWGMVHGNSHALPFRFDETLRVDLYHAGDAQHEQYMLDELRAEGPWPGSRTHLIDRNEYGCAMAEIYSEAPHRELLFRHDYCSLFGEWQTTDEAKTRQRTFSETIRLPMPRHKVWLEIKSRQRQGKYIKIFETPLDPQSLDVIREQRQGELKVLKLYFTGPSKNKLDIVILGDGYQQDQMDKFRQDAKRYSQLLLKTAPFAELRLNLNIWAVESPSRESGVDEPRKGIFRDTALSMSFNTFGSSRYLMTTDNKAVRNIAANAPYDTLIIMSNTNRYGGGGIYNLYSSFISDNDYDEYVVAHEFGHSLAGLGDEYYNSKVAYNDMYPKGVEPWEPNLTVQTTRAQVKWGTLIAPGTPIPTQENDPRFTDKVGLFEGAGYSAKDIFRPFKDCKMFNKGYTPFCPVCRKAIADQILKYR